MSRLHALTLICLVAAGQSFAYSSPREPKRVVIKQYGFSIEAPAGWRVGVREKDGLPMFVNVPWSRLGPQLRLPKGGATMHIVTEEGLPGGPRSHRDYTLDRWLEFDQKSGAKVGTASSRIFEMPPSAAVTGALFSKFDIATFGPDDQRQSEAAIYWEFRGKRFAMYLFYVVGDPRGQQYEDILAKAARSIRPL